MKTIKRKQAAKEIYLKARTYPQNGIPTEVIEEILASVYNKHEQLFLRFKQSLERLTPGGSEFVDDPERCADFVRSVRDNQHKQIIKLAKEKRNV